MEMVVLLLLSAVAQLVVSAPQFPNAAARHNLKAVINKIQKLNETLANDFFVEDVSELADAGCKDEFFCKVHSILDKHEKFEDTKKDQTAIVDHLKSFIDNLNINCTAFLSTAKPVVAKPLPVLLDNLKKCSQRRNTLSE